MAEAPLKTGITTNEAFEHFLGFLDENESTPQTVALADYFANALDEADGITDGLIGDLLSSTHFLPNRDDFKNILYNISPLQKVPAIFYDLAADYLNEQLNPTVDNGPTMRDAGNWEIIGERVILRNSNGQVVSARNEIFQNESNSSSGLAFVPPVGVLMPGISQPQQPNTVQPPAPGEPITVPAMLATLGGLFTGAAIGSLIVQPIKFNWLPYTQEYIPISKRITPVLTGPHDEPVRTPPPGENNPTKPPPDKTETPPKRYRYVGKTSEPVEEETILIKPAPFTEDEFLGIRDLEIEAGKFEGFELSDFFEVSDTNPDIDIFLPQCNTESSETSDDQNLDLGAVKDGLDKLFSADKKGSPPSSPVYDLLANLADQRISDLLEHDDLWNHGEINDDAVERITRKLKELLQTISKIFPGLAPATNTDPDIEPNSILPTYIYGDIMTEDQLVEILALEHVLQHLFLNGNVTKPVLAKRIDDEFSIYVVAGKHESNMGLDFELVYTPPALPAADNTVVMTVGAVLTNDGFKIVKVQGGKGLTKIKVPNNTGGNVNLLNHAQRNILSGSGFADLGPWLLGQTVKIIKQVLPEKTIELIRPESQHWLVTEIKKPEPENIFLITNDMAYWLGYKPPEEVSQLIGKRKEELLKQKHDLERALVDPGDDIHLLNRNKNLIDKELARIAQYERSLASYARYATQNGFTPSASNPHWWVHP